MTDTTAFREPRTEQLVLTTFAGLMALGDASPDFTRCQWARLEADGSAPVLALVVSGPEAHLLANAVSHFLNEFVNTVANQGSLLGDDPAAAERLTESAFQAVVED